MADTPVVAEAVVYTPGEHNVAESDAVTGVAVGKPVQRQESSQAPPAEPSAAVVATSFLYSPAMAKVFTQFDTDSSGSLELKELTKLVGSLGLSEEDAVAALKRCDDNGDQKIQLEEWEKGLDDRLRGLIEANLNAEGKL